MQTSSLLTWMIHTQFSPFKPSNLFQLNSTTTLHITLCHHLWVRQCLLMQGCPTYDCHLQQCHCKQLQCGLVHEGLNIKTLKPFLHKTCLLKDFHILTPTSLHTDAIYLWMRENYDDMKPLYHLTLLIAIIVASTLLSYKYVYNTDNWHIQGGQPA